MLIGKLNQGLFSLGGGQRSGDKDCGLNARHALFGEVAFTEASGQILWSVARG